MKICCIVLYQNKLFLKIKEIHMPKILTDIQIGALRAAGISAQMDADAAFDEGGSLYRIRALQKNTYPTVFRSFLETRVSDIVPEYEIIEGSYDFISAHFPSLDFRCCAKNDLFRPKKNDEYDRYPLLTESGIILEESSSDEAETRKGFLVFVLHEYQLIRLSVVSRTGAFPEIVIFEKERNDIILDSLVERRNAIKEDRDFVIKKNSKIEGENI